MSVACVHEQRKCTYVLTVMHVKRSRNTLFPGMAGREMARGRGHGEMATGRGHEEIETGR